MKKYEVDRTAYSDGRMPDNDIVLYRYADVLLMKSEAKVRNGESGDEEMNAVRSRVGMQYDIHTQSEADKKGYTTVFPIPEKAHELNPNLKQNPGY